VHPDKFPVTVTNIETTELTTISNTVASLTGMAVQRNKAIVGANAFSHESGIHQDGVLKHQATYEIMTPESVGLNNHDGMVLGKLSGRHAFKNRMIALGYDLEDDDELKRTFVRFKQVADSKNSITDGDLHAIYRDVIRAEAITEHWKLNSVSVVSGSAGMGSSTATVAMTTPDGDIIINPAVSTGPIDAIYQAIDDIVKIDATLKDYRIGAVGGGSDALGEVSVLIEGSETGAEGIFSGSGSDGDVLQASAIAYVNAINSLYSAQMSSAAGGDTVISKAGLL